METLTKNYKLLALILISVSLVFAYPLSVVFMNHEMSIEVMHHSPINGQSIIPGQPMSDATSCVDFHLGLFQKLSECSPRLSNTNAISLLFAIALVLLLGLAISFTELNSRVNFHYQRLKPISLASYLKQLGNWLVIIEKKAPAYAFAIA